MCSMCCRARREESTRGLLPELSSQHDILPIRHNHTASEQDWLPLAGSLDIDGANGERDVQQVRLILAVATFSLNWWIYNRSLA